MKRSLPRFEYRGWHLGDSVTVPTTARCSDLPIPAVTLCRLPGEVKEGDALVIVELVRWKSQLLGVRLVALSDDYAELRDQLNRSFKQTGKREAKQFLGRTSGEVTSETTTWFMREGDFKLTDGVGTPDGAIGFVIFDELQRRVQREAQYAAPNTIYDEFQVDSLATPRRPMRFSYPSNVRRGAKAKLTLEFVVDTLGRVEPESVRELDPNATYEVGFFENTKRSLLLLEFTPASRNGRKVRNRLRQVFEFSAPGYADTLSVREPRAHLPH